MPIRIQRKRTKGWRMPEGAVSVCRPGPLGNPFTVAQVREVGYRVTDRQAQEMCVEALSAWINGSSRDWMGPESDAARSRALDALEVLRGKDLACWCIIGSPCHADVLLDLANRPRD